MKISPAYDRDPIIRLDGDPSAVGAPFLRQRRRLGKVLATLSDQQWQTPSRCAEWRVQDVVAHLAGVDQFWNLSITSGVGGAPTRFLDGFDPKATPASMVEAVRDASPADTLASFLQNCGALCATVESLDSAGWTALAETPPGHISTSGAVHHALWDAWVHERDILLPVGLEQDHEDDEILAGLRYVAALGPAFAVQSTPGRTGALAIEVTRPTANIVLTVDDDVEVAEGASPEGALVLRGDAVEVVEALSVRAPWHQSIPEDQAWLVSGLSEVFESTAS